tara:strand:+ start:1768 stop:3405 length:1638 start_codon:yes stop_codon:yes gene_type:complete
MNRFSRFLNFDPRSTKYFKAAEKLLTPRFLYELIIPQDIFSVLSKLNISDGKEEAVFRFILAASIFNGIFIGLPGTVGWGVIVSQVIEFIMATRIAFMVGLVPDIASISIKKIVKLLTAAGLTAITVMLIFKKVLNLVFNVVANIIPFGFATATAELITTLFYGLFIYLAFLEIQNHGENEKLSLTKLGKVALNAGNYTRKISTSLFTLLYKDAPRLLREIKDNIVSAWNGVLDEAPKLQGDLFLSGCLVFLLEEETGKLQGPFSSLWLEAWRKALPVQLGDDASPEEISALANSYDASRLDNIRQNVEAKFYEILETTHENVDEDSWSATLINDQNHPASDAIFVNSETGRVIEINYKFTENTNYIESHIANYPGVPIIAPPEVAEKINSPFVLSGNYEKQTVQQFNEQNFDSILDKNFGETLAAPLAAGGLEFTGRTLPFFSAYFRGNITREQFTTFLKTISPEITARTLNRIAILTMLGPVYGMFLIAGTGFKGTLSEPSETPLNKEGLRSKTSKDEIEKEDEKKEYNRRDFITLSFLKNFD